MKRVAFVWSFFCFGLTLISGCGQGTDGSDPSNESSASSSEVSSEVSPEAAAVANSESGSGRIAEVLEEPDFYRRIQRLTELLSTEDESLLPEVKTALNRYRPEESVAEFGMLLRFWSEREPEAAADWSLGIGTTRFKPASVFTVFESWAAKDPSAALISVQRTAIETDEVSRVAQMALIHGWFRRDRAEVEEYLKTQGVGVSQQRAIFAYALSLVSADGVQAGIDWANSQPEEPAHFRRSATQQVMNALSLHDLDEAVRWCDTICLEPGGRSFRNPLMRARLREHHPGGEVLEWMANAEYDASDPQERVIAIRVTFATWVRSRKAEALAWVREVDQTESAPEWLPEIYPAYAAQIASESPQEGIEWARRIEEPLQREQSLIRVLQIWRETDPHGADQWIESSSELSERAIEKARTPRVKY